MCAAREVAGPAHRGRVVQPSPRDAALSSSDLDVTPARRPKHTHACFRNISSPEQVSRDYGASCAATGFRKHTHEY